MQKLKTIIIEAELAVPLDELAIYTLPKKEDASSIVELLNKKPDIANFIIEKIARKIIRKKKLDLKLEKLEFDYNDLDSIERGMAYFKVKLEGTEKNLKRIAGENRLFFFDWNARRAS